MLLVCSSLRPATEVILNNNKTAREKVAQIKENELEQERDNFPSFGADTNEYKIIYQFIA